MAKFKTNKTCKERIQLPECLAARACPTLGPWLDRRGLVGAMALLGLTWGPRPWAGWGSPEEAGRGSDICEDTQGPGTGSENANIKETKVDAACGLLHISFLTCFLP